MLQHLHHREGCAGQDGFLLVEGRIEEADVLVHVEDVLVGEALDVFVQCDQLLDVLVLAGGAREYGVVDYDAVDGWVGVGAEDGVFDVFLGDEAEVEEETAGGGVWLVYGSLGVVLGMLDIFRRQRSCSILRLPRCL